MNELKATLNWRLNFQYPLMVHTGSCGGYNIVLGDKLEEC